MSQDTPLPNPTPGPTATSHSNKAFLSIDFGRGSNAKSTICSL